MDILDSKMSQLDLLAALDSTRSSKGYSTSENPVRQGWKDLRILKKLACEIRTLVLLEAPVGLAHCGASQIMKEILQPTACHCLSPRS